MSTPAALHTVDQVLHPAARSDFDRHVGQLLAEGREREAHALWASVVEVRHLAPPEEEPLQQPGMPPITTSVCTAIDCRRCEGLHGGYQFPWIGRWTRSGVLVHEGVNPQEAWEAWNTSETYLDVVQLQMHWSGISAEQMVPAAWAAILQRCQKLPGCASKLEVFTCWRDWQLGSKVWIDPFATPLPTWAEGRSNRRARAQRALCDWLEWDPAYLVPCSCQRCGQGTRNICADCFLAICPECEAEAAQRGFPAICCPEMAAGESRRFPVPPLRPGQTDVDVFRAIMGLPERRR